MRQVSPKDKNQLQRLAYWNQWLINFKDYGRSNGYPRFTYIKNAAWLLNDLYWRLVEQYLRPVLISEKEEQEEHKIHPYKIISASEIAVMMTEPISVKNNEIEERRLNATLAWFIATSIIEGWDTKGPVKITKKHIEKVAGYKEYIDTNKRYPESFVAEHLQWLINLNVTLEKPFQLNAQTWRLFYLSCLTVASDAQLI